MPSIEISHGCAKGERPLIPQVCRVIEITQETPDVKSFRLQTLDGKKPFDCEPGQLGMFGPTEILYSFDTYQFNDYSRYDAAMLPEEHKARMRETQFPKDLQKAYELGKRLHIGYIAIL